MPQQAELRELNPYKVGARGLKERAFNLMEKHDPQELMSLYNLIWQTCAEEKLVGEVNVVLRDYDNFDLSIIGDVSNVAGLSILFLYKGDWVTIKMEEVEIGCAKCCHGVIVGTNIKGLKPFMREKVRSE